ncbi:BTB domain-containing protein [Aphelenchoides fujianensis]|nr:BTB domain-containing protein [Aphelenchoides fujianensis]
MSTAHAFRPQGRPLPRPAGQQGPRLHRNPAIPGGGKRGRFGPSKVLTGMWAMTVDQFREHMRKSRAENPTMPGDIVVTLDGLPAAEFYARQAAASGGKSPKVVEQPQAEQQVKKPVDKAAALPQPSDFRRRLWAMCTAGLFADVRVAVGQTVFSVAKNVLAAESPFFRARFQAAPDCALVEIAGHSPAAVRAALEFVYVGELDDYAVPGLCEAAAFFQLDELKERCPAGIHAGNLVQEIVAALKSGDKQHQDAILAFIFEHPAEAQQAAQSAEVATLAAVQPELAAQITTILAMKKPAV